MFFLQMLLTPDELRIFVVNNQDICVGREIVELRGQSFHLSKCNQCFDWLFGEEGGPAGVELRLELADPLITSHDFLLKAPYITINQSFLRIWFSTQRVAENRYYEDWEDYYYQSANNNNNLLIFLSTHFLTADELKKLEKKGGRD